MTPTTTRPKVTAPTSTPTSTPTTATGRSLARRARGPAIAIGVFALLAGLTAVGSDTGIGLLDTRSPSKAGSKAIAELLGAQRVNVRQVRTIDEARGTNGGTLVVAGADVLTPAAARAVATSTVRRIVVIGATNTDVVEAFAPGTTVVRTAELGVRQAACDLPAAASAGSADAGGALYRPPTPLPPATTAVGCYPVGGEPSLLALATQTGTTQMVTGQTANNQTRTVILLGAATAVRNDQLDHEGNAALALNLLGAEGPVTWYLPSLDDIYGTANAASSPWDLAPRGVLWAVGWLALVVVLLAAWRARRLGPVVSENLPVVVRASETVEGRARLYRRGGDRGRAADLLRTAARDRLAPALGLPVNPPRESVIDAVARRTTRPPAEVAALLYGAAPPGDAALVRLADDLDRLDREVRRT